MICLPTPIIARQSCPAVTPNRAVPPVEKTTDAVPIREWRYQRMIVRAEEQHAGPDVLRRQQTPQLVALRRGRVEAVEAKPDVCGGHEMRQELRVGRLPACRQLRGRIRRDELERARTVFVRA